MARVSETTAQNYVNLMLHINIKKKPEKNFFSSALSCRNVVSTQPIIIFDLLGKINSRLLNAKHWRSKLKNEYIFSWVSSGALHAYK